MLGALLMTAAAPVAVPPEPALTEQIAKADADLFRLFFTEPCDEPRMRGMLAGDIEFYHDKAGVTARSADEFITDYLQNCKSREDPTAWRSRRELVVKSLHVDPVPGFGAMEFGEHLFYERKGVDGVEKLAGRALFAMVWELTPDGKWKLKRVLSYSHAPAR